MPLDKQYNYDKGGKGYTMLPNPIIDDNRLRGRERQLLEIALQCPQSDKSGNPWRFHVGWFSERLNISEKTVVRLVKILKKLGYCKGDFGTGQNSTITFYDKPQGTADITERSHKAKKNAAPIEYNDIEKSILDQWNLYFPEGDRFHIADPYSEFFAGNLYKSLVKKLLRSDVIDKDETYFDIYNIRQVFRYVSSHGGDSVDRTTYGLSLTTVLKYETFKHFLVLQEMKSIQLKHTEEDKFDRGQV